MLPTVVSTVFGTKNSPLEGREDPETMETVEIDEVGVPVLILVAEVPFAPDTCGSLVELFLAVLMIPPALLFPFEIFSKVLSLLSLAAACSFDPAAAAVEIFPVPELF